MDPDTFHADAAASDPAAGTAFIQPVTPEMMDEAAHKAAQRADDVAHHAVPASEAEPDAAVGSDAAAEPASEPAASEAAVVEPVSEFPSTLEAAAAAETVDDAVRDVADRIDDTLSRTSAAAQSRVSGGSEILEHYNAALLGMVQANLAATGEHVAALTRAQSLPEIVAINAEHMRRHLDALTAQGRDLATLTRKLTFAAFEPSATTGRREP